MVGFIAVGVLSATNGGRLDNNLDLPGTESQRAFDLLRSKFPELAGDTAVVAFRAEDGVTEEAVRSRMEQVFAEIERLDHVVAVRNPYSTPGMGVSRDGRIAFAMVQFDVRATE
ncbi:MAG: MMPL family transporter, partial [Acidimicrobiales bacterium]